MQVSVVRRRGRRRPHSSEVFFSETTGPIKVKFHMKPPWDRETEVWLNFPDHMTTMAAMPIYEKKHI